MVFSVWMDFATGGGGGAGALAVLAVLSSAFRNVLMRRKRTTTDFFINPPFACGRARTGGIIAIWRGSRCQKKGMRCFMKESPNQNRPTANMHAGERR